MILPKRNRRDNYRYAGVRRKTIYLFFNLSALPIPKAFPSRSLFSNKSFLFFSGDPHSMSLAWQCPNLSVTRVISFCFATKFFMH